MGGWAHDNVQLDLQARSFASGNVARATGLLEARGNPIMQFSKGLVRTKALDTQVELAGKDGDTVALNFTWGTNNIGVGPGRAAIRLNLQIDSGFGDVSQLIVENDRRKEGALAGVAQVLTGPPVTIEPGTTQLITLDVDIPFFNIDDRQGSVAFFSWWIVELTMWDVDKNEQISNNFEHRDFFRVSRVSQLSDIRTQGVPSAAVFLL